jgi:cellulose synthase operon protein C
MFRMLRQARIFRGGRKFWIAFGACAAAAAAAVAVPRIWSSRAVAERRAALSLRRAREHLAARQFEPARTELRTALRLSPRNAEARGRLAATELETGNWELAFLEYQSLTELHPDEAEGWIGLARILARSGLHAAPEAALDSAIALAPDRVDARALRAQLRYRVGRYFGARLDAEAAVKLDPALAQPLAPMLSGRGAPPAVSPERIRAERESTDNPLAAAREHWPGRLAQVRQALEAAMRRQDWAAGERTVAAAEQAYPGTAFAPFLAGILALARGDAAAADKQLSESLALSPRSPLVATTLAKSWSRENGAAFAAGRLIALAEADPGFSFARFMGARAFLDARDPVQAESAARKGVQARPDSPEAYRQLAQFYLDGDRAPEAAAVLQEAVDRFPMDVELHAMYAQLHSEAGRIDDAIRLEEEIVARHPDLDAFAYRLGTLLASRDAPSPRLSQLAADLRFDRPADPGLLDALGWIRHRAGTGGARELLESAVKAAPDDPAAHFHLAAVYAAEKQHARARDELKLALGMGRAFPERVEATRLLREIDVQSTAAAAPRR